MSRCQSSVDDKLEPADFESLKPREKENQFRHTQKQTHTHSLRDRHYTLAQTLLQAVIASLVPDVHCLPAN